MCSFLLVSVLTQIIMFSCSQVRELEGLDLTTPSSPLGSTSSLSAPEWASDGYGSSEYFHTVTPVTCEDFESLLYLDILHKGS